MIQGQTMHFGVKSARLPAYPWGMGVLMPE